MRPNLPPVIKTLLIINVLAWLAQIALANTVDLTELGGLHYWRSPLFKPHQLITHMFLHDPKNPMHLIFNMLTLWVFGSTLENFWGPKRFLNFYLICGLGAALVQMALIPFEVTRQVHAAADIPVEYWPQAIQMNVDGYNMIGASGAIMGLAAGFAYLFPNTEFFIYFIPIPIKAKFLVPIYVLIDLFGGLNRSSGDNVGHFAHLGGALVGLLIVMFWNRNNRRNFY
jgi:membrane associated rhomboid family serine protease